MDEHATLAPVKDRAASAVAVLCGQRGYVNDDGERDGSKIGDVLYEHVVKAVAEKKGDRPDVQIKRRALVEFAFGNIPGPESWDAAEDPELAREVYVKLDGITWRLCETRPTAYLQQRLNSNTNLVLCRTKSNRDQADAVYVTRDKACILEDLLKGIKDSQKKRADADAALTAMLIDRVPEHAKVWSSDLIGNMKAVLEGARATIAGPMAAAEITAATDSPDE